MEKINKSAVDPLPLKEFKETRVVNGSPQSTRYTPDFINPYKNDYKKSLLAEQYFLCAYCNKLLDDTNLYKFKIEHWYPQTLCRLEPHDNTINGRDLTHENMLIVCSGENVNPNFRHCDSSRIPRHILTIKPQDNQYQFAAILRYEGAKLISDDPTIQNDIDNELNLNESNLIGIRRVVLDQFIKNINQIGKNFINKQALLHKYSNASNGKKYQYCTLMLYYINKHL